MTSAAEQGASHDGSSSSRASSDPVVLELVAVIGQGMQEETATTVSELTNKLAAEIQPLGEGGDRYMYEQLLRSVEGNVEALTYMIASHVPLDRVQPPTAAIEYAIRLAQRGTPSHSLVRAYHMGQDHLMSRVFEFAEKLDCGPELKLQVLNHVSTVFYRYLDWIIQLLVGIYEEERQRWLQTEGNMRASAVHKVLANEAMTEAEFTARTGYALGQHHVGIVARSTTVSEHGDELIAVERAIRALPGAMNALIVAVDRSSAWAWVPRRDDSAISMDEVRAALAPYDGCEIAVGASAYGAEGVRHTHEQAMAVRALLHSNSGVEARAVGYSEPGVAVVAMLARDIGTTKRWVRDVLGPLAAATPAARELRRTLRIYLRCGENYSRAAETLHLHRNSVKYRVTKALGERPTALEQGKADLSLALLACFYLGEAVLDAK